jgi:hypothetical protein
MTTITEKRREIDAIALFLVIAFALAAWRGSQGAPIIAGAFALGAVGILIAWLYWRRKPASIIAVSPEEIFFGRLDQSGTVIERTEGGRLQFREGLQGSGWFLMLVDEPDKPGISMIGFDVGEVRAVCDSHGWVFA